MSKTIMDKKEKINYILDRLKTIWLKYPDLRLGQMLCNITEMYSPHTFETGPYYYSDNDMVTTLKKMSKTSNDSLEVSERNIITFLKNVKNEETISIYCNVSKTYLGECYKQGLDLLAIKFLNRTTAKEEDPYIDEATVELLINKKILFLDTEEDDVVYYTLDSNINGVDAVNVVYDKKFKDMQFSFLPSILLITNLAKLIDPNITYNTLEESNYVDLKKSLKGF